MHCNAANAFAAEGIIHYARQAQIEKNPENSERRRCGLSAGKGVTGVHSAGEVRYLRLPCSYWYCRLWPADRL